MTLTKQVKIEKLADFFTNKFKPYFFTTLGKLSKKKYSKISNKNQVDDSLSDIWNFLINLWNNISCTSYSSVSELKKKISKIISKLKPSFIDILYEYFIGKEEKKKNNGGGEEEEKEQNMRVVTKNSYLTAIIESINNSFNNILGSHSQINVNSQFSFRSIETSLISDITKLVNNSNNLNNTSNMQIFRQSIMTFIEESIKRTINESNINSQHKEIKEELKNMLIGGVRNALNLVNNSNAKRREEQNLKRAEEQLAREAERRREEAQRLAREEAQRRETRMKFELLIPNGNNGVNKCWINTVLCLLICNRTLFNYNNTNLNITNGNQIKLLQNSFALLQNDTQLNKMVWKNGLYLEIFNLIRLIAQSSNVPYKKAILNFIPTNFNDATMLLNFIINIFRRSSNPLITNLYNNLETNGGILPNGNNNEALNAKQLYIVPIKQNQEVSLIGYISSSAEIPKTGIISHWIVFLRESLNNNNYIEIDFANNPKGVIDRNMRTVLNVSNLNPNKAYIGLYITNTYLRENGIIP